MADTFQKQSISGDLARRVISAAEDKARQLGVPMNIAVVDESGESGAPSTAPLVGAIGVSGGHYTQDQEVAEAGVAVVGS